MIKHHQFVSLRLSSEIVEELNLQPNRSAFVRNAIIKALRAQQNAA